MKYVCRNGVRLSNMTLGTSQIGLNYGVANTSGQPNEEESRKMLQCALANGVSSFDTANAYGESEERLGRFFQSPYFSGGQPYITTKFRVGIGPPVAGGVLLPANEMKKIEQEAIGLGGEIEKLVFESAEASLEKLRLKKAGCIMLHSPIEMIAGGRRLAKAMGRLVSAGYADEVGVSLYFPGEADIMLSHGEYTATQAPASLFDQKMIYSGAFERMAKKGIAVFVRSVFMQGVFFLDPDNIGDPLLEEHAAPHIRTLRQLSQHEGVSVAQLAISYVRDTAGVTSLVLGCDTKGQLMENTSLMEGPSVSEETMGFVREAFSVIDYESIMAVLRRGKDGASYHEMKKKE